MLRLVKLISVVWISIHSLPTLSRKISPHHHSWVVIAFLRSNRRKLNSINNSATLWVQPTIRIFQQPIPQQHQPRLTNLLALMK